MRTLLHIRSARSCGSRLLIQNYVSIADARVLELDLDTGNLNLLAGGSVNRASRCGI